MLITHRVYPPKKNLCLEDIMFCVECGKETTIFRNGVCIECYLKTHQFTKGSEIIDIPVCPHCQSYKYKNTWTSELFDDVLIRYIKHSFKISPELTKVTITTSCNMKKNEAACNVFISGTIDDNAITEDHDLLVRFQKIVCDVCSKRFGGYHEAILQIRADKRALSIDELTNIKLLVENFVEQLQAKGNRSLFITDVDEQHGGIDFYLSDRNSGQMIAKKIQEECGGKITQSSKNVGMKDSKQVYRMTYLVRLPLFKKDDFFSLGNLVYGISRIAGNKLYAYELSTWKAQTFTIDDLQHARLLGGKELIKEMILISQSEQEVQVMSPDTFVMLEVIKPKKIRFTTEKIPIIKIGSNFFIFPMKQNVIDKYGN